MVSRRPVPGRGHTPPRPSSRTNPVIPSQTAKQYAYCSKCGSALKQGLGECPNCGAVNTPVTTPQPTISSQLGWEYKVVKISMGGRIDPNIDQVNDKWLNSFGSAGWELTSVVPMTRGGGLTVAEYFIFKRRMW